MDFRQRRILECFHKVRLKLNQSFSRYLDLGCGDGSFTLAIASLLGVKHVYGVGIDERAVEKARSKDMKLTY